MTNPYLLPRPAVVSFSGGRTSGYMLRQIIDAHAGRLPDDIYVVFCNTGAECHETLDFVERVSQRWDVPINWLEYRWIDGKAEVVVVDYASASRDHEPFTQLIASSGVLPNPVMRKCTIEMKLKTTNRFVRRILGLESYSNAIGIRADEPKRLAKVLMPKQHKVTVQTLFGDEQETVGKVYLTGETPLCPLGDAGVTVDDVMAFWKNQPFDLELESDFGNCTLCFLKGAAKIVKIMRARPESATWWRERERERFNFQKRHTSGISGIWPGFVPTGHLTTSCLRLPWIGKKAQDGFGLIKVQTAPAEQLMNAAAPTEVPCD